MMCRTFMMITCLVASTSAKSMHDNMVYFSGATNVAFDLDDHSITNGQPWGGVSSSGDNGLDIKAGRHGDATPAGFFKDGINVGQMMGLNTMVGLGPAKLNFAIKGTLSLTIDGKDYKCNNIHLGQGHAFTDNNWWIGGKGCLGTSKANELNCPHVPILGGCGVTFSNGDDDHTFVVGSDASFENSTTAAKVAEVAMVAEVAPLPETPTSTPAWKSCKSGDLQCAKSSGEGSYCKYWLDKPVCQGSNKACQCSCRGDSFCQSAVRPDSYCKYWQPGTGKVCQYSTKPCECK